MHTRFSRFCGLLLCLIFWSSITITEAYDALDPNANITIKWDITMWTGDGYVADVKIFNFQQYRHIEAPGWQFGWTWKKKEVIWAVTGGQATEQGDCSKFKGNTPHSCKKSPTIVDLLPGVPYNQQVSNCCRGGVISSWAQDPATAVAAFQISVGQSGTTNTTVRAPRNVTFKGPGPGTLVGLHNLLSLADSFQQINEERLKLCVMTWNITCTYSQFLARKTPTCCVSLSSFYNNTIVPCPTCSCGCQNSSEVGSCVNSKIASVVPALRKNNKPLLQCTQHMCPIRVHWHVKTNYKEYWRVKVAITNFNYNMNYSQWNIVVQHPNFDNLTQLFSFNYKPLNPYAGINDTALLWGIKFYNDFLTQAGPSGNVQSELLFRKNPLTFTFDKGWAFPRRIYFNGDSCVMPPLEAYPWLPNATPDLAASPFIILLITFLSVMIHM